MTEHRTGTPFTEDTDTDREAPQPRLTGAGRRQTAIPRQSRWKFSSAVEAARHLGSTGTR